MTAFARRQLYNRLIKRLTNKIGDKMARVTKIQCEYDVSLRAIIGFEQEVTYLTINSIAMGDANGEAKLRLSNDEQVLYVYLDSKYTWACMISIEDIKTMSFKMCEEFIEVEF